MFFHLAELVHEMLQLGDAVIMQEDTVELSPPVLVLVFLHYCTTFMTHTLYQIFNQLSDFCIVRDVICQVAELVLHSVIAMGFLD